MRGSLVDLISKIAKAGIIPAHAGLTIHEEIGGKEYLGSSPRMRGSHGTSQNVWKDDRIIPAHAGLTPRALLSARFRRDHPRACGAHTKKSQC